MRVVMIPRALALSLFALATACSSSPDDAAARSADTTAPCGSDAGAADATSFADGSAFDAAPDTNATDASDAAPHAHRHARCGWIGGNDANGVAAFVAHAAWFDAVHPDWYGLAADGVSIRTITGAGDASLLAAAAAHDVLVIPMVDGAESGDEVRLRAMMSDAAQRKTHIANLVALAVDNHYPGLDLDYEHLWEASDRPLFTTFIQEAAAAMHAAGKELSIAIPALDNASVTNAWDFDALSQALDALHVMGYDYHSIGTHPGPTAPLGWIEAVNAHAAATGRADRFKLGLPNYGTTPTWFGTLSDCLARCNGTYATSTDEMASCAYNVDTHYGAGRSLSCMTSDGALFFDDTASLEEKVMSAKAHGLGGVTYWTIGGEPAGFFDMIPKYF